MSIVKVGYFLTQYFARHWLELGIRGRVLFTGSINGLLAEPDHTATMRRKQRLQIGAILVCCVGSSGIRVNSLAQGLVRTPLTIKSWIAIKSTKVDGIAYSNGQVPSADACGPLAAFL